VEATDRTTAWRNDGVEDEVDDLGKGGLIVHDDDGPQAFETPRGRVGRSAITPTPDVFVRNILPAPGPDHLRLGDRASWLLDVTGVRRPGRISLAELTRLPRREVTAVLQCSGNGRSFTAHDPEGVAWGVGAVANVTWAGVAVSTVLDAFGGADHEARYLTATGGEPVPRGVPERDVVVERSIPAAKARRDCLLAWEMNGEPLTRAHGAPLRLIVPGYYGVNSVKYVARLALSAVESDARLQALDYRLGPIGHPPSPAQPSMWEMDVKSFVTRPVAGSNTPGDVLVEGVAFGGESPVDRVEVSLDGGVTWLDADLGDRPRDATAWRRWSHRASVGEGRLDLVSRATDGRGRTQPEHGPENASGYANNGWRDHAVTVVGAHRPGRPPP
jgi:DMSO/TMAO reductase YedYZ molybdopterin-dependent catalytic subunit